MICFDCFMALTISYDWYFYILKTLISYTLIAMN